MTVRIHETAEVSPKATIGHGTSIWHQSQVREGVVIGENCVISKGVYIDFDVQIGSQVKIQNYVSVYHGVKIEDGVFVGPHVCFTNDLQPRAINPDGTLKAGDDWTLSETLIQMGSAIGANSTIVCGITLGKWSMIGSGTVVTKNVPDFGLVYGNPGKLRGFVDKKGRKVQKIGKEGSYILASSGASEHIIKIPTEIWKTIND